MPQSLAKIIVHLIYSTKNRQPWLTDLGLRKELYAVQATLLRDNVDSPAIIINGVEDHVHALFLLSRKFAPMAVVEEVKTESTKWLKKQSPELADFHWQAGYGAFSVSESQVERVKQYIADQERHHATMTYQDEFRLLCRKHGVPIDERYVWD